MHVHIINELNVVSGPAEGTALQEWRIARTHESWQAVTEKKKHSTLLPKKYHRSAIICTPSTGTSPLAFSQERPLSQQPVPCSTWRYQDICVHIHMVRVCAECQTVCNVATSDAYRAPHRHVWRVGFPSAPLTACGVARSDRCSVVQSCDCSVAKRTVPILATLLFRLSVSLKNWIIHRRRVCLYMLSTTEGARRVANASIDTKKRTSWIIRRQRKFCIDV